MPRPSFIRHLLSVFDIGDEGPAGPPRPIPGTGAGPVYNPLFQEHLHGRNPRHCRVPDTDHASTIS
jgi:hypothetical protein